MVAISNDVDHCMEACLVHYHEELVLLYLIGCKNLCQCAVLLYDTWFISSIQFRND